MAESEVLIGDKVQSLPEAGRQAPALAALRWTVKHLMQIKVLLVFVPLGFLAGILEWSPLATLAFNFLAIIPLSAFVSDASDNISEYWGSLLGRLVNATFGNAVELIFGILAISHGQSSLAQSAMLGSILSDILLVNGACLIAAAGWKRTCYFNPAVAEGLSSLMVITAMALVLPTALYATNSSAPDIDAKILDFSRATASVLLLIYLGYLYFQLWTHKAIFLDEEDDTHDKGKSGRPELRHDENDNDDKGNKGGTGPGQQHDENKAGSAQVGDKLESSSSTRAAADDTAAEQQQEESSMPGLYVTLGILVVSAAAIMSCTRRVLEKIDETSEISGVSKTFIATILIPIASNAPECLAVIVASRKSRINFAIGVIVGSILQIAVFVLPFLVIVGYFIGEPMTLYLQTSQTSILFLAILTVTHLHQDGSYTYLHGVMLVCLYAVFVMAILILPEV